MTGMYLPEGRLLHTEENQRYLSTEGSLREAAALGVILEARAVLCDADRNLHVPLPCMPGLIPYEEGALGLDDGTTRDIALISRVSKPVCFTVRRIETTAAGPRAILSRRDAQRRCRYYVWDQHRPGDIVEARVTRLESFGAFCDVGCGLPALLPIANLSVSRIAHPADRLSPGMDILAVVTSLENRRICLSQRELLGTWEENAALFHPGETVAGIVRSLENYGIFVELTPNLAGLAEPRSGVMPGQVCSAYIKSILPEKMKLKLVIIDAGNDPLPPAPPRYFLREGHLDHWVYSPPLSPRRIETVFSPD